MDTAVVPFPAHIFEETSKTDLQNLLEVIHYATLAETPKAVKDVLIRRVFRCLERKLSTNMAVPVLEEWIWGC